MMEVDLERRDGESLGGTVLMGDAFFLGGVDDGLGKQGCCVVNWLSIC